MCLEQFSGNLSALRNLAGRKTFSIERSALLDDTVYLEAAPAKNFLEGTHRPKRLLENQIERPARGTSRNKNGLFTAQ